MNPIHYVLDIRQKIEAIETKAIRRYLDTIPFYYILEALNDQDQEQYQYLTNKLKQHYNKPLSPQHKQHNKTKP